MKYPQALTSKLEEVETIVGNWSISITFEDVVKWMMQFDNSDFDLAFRIIKNLNIIGYDELKSGLNIAYSKLERKAIDKSTKISSKNTLFAGIGEGGKSGAMIGYSFRISNELSEENFLDEDSFIHIEEGRIENLVLVDDIISTGNQAIQEIRKLTDSLIPLGVKNIFLLTAVGMKEGIKKVEEETGAYVFSAFEYDINDTVVSFDSLFYEGLEFEQRKNLKSRLEYYGKICNPKSPLGYGNVGGLIIFYYNTPNSTIPHIWTTLNSWLPLFKRTLRINGIDSYYKQFDNLKSQRPKSQNEKNEFTLFVEGKSEELFFDLLSDRLKKATGYKHISTVALGGSYSEKLIENLNKTEKQYLFIIEDDPYAPLGYKARINKLFKDEPNIRMSPIIDYFNFESLLADDDLMKNSVPTPINEEDISTREFRRNLEIRLFRRYPLSMREVVLRKLVDNHIDEEKVGKLLNEINDKINTQKTSTANPNPKKK